MEQVVVVPQADLIQASVHVGQEMGVAGVLTIA